MALKKLKWWGAHRVAAGSPDVRGWRVVGADGTELGTVEDLIFEPEPARVRYVGVRIAEEKVLVPVANLELDVKGRVAHVSGPLSGLVDDGTQVQGRRDGRD